VGEWIYRLLTSALVGGEWSASRIGRFIPVERAAGTYWIGGWMGSSTGLDDVRKLLTLPGLRLRPLDRLARSLSPDRLHYLDIVKYNRDDGIVGETRLNFRPKPS
jgi:hypothetical protein